MHNDIISVIGLLISHDSSTMLCYLTAKLSDLFCQQLNRRKETIAQIWPREKLCFFLIDVKFLDRNLLSITLPARINISLRFTHY